MPYVSASPQIGVQAIETSDTSQKHPLGAVVEIQDPTLGKGRAIYLKGVASTAAGDAVTYDVNFQTTRATATTRGPIAIALSANGANSFGWYQIEGIAVANVGTFTSGGRVYLGATAGQLTTTVTAGQGVDGARAMSNAGTPSTGKAYVSLVGPSADGNG